MYSKYSRQWANGAVRGKCTTDICTRDVHRTEETSFLWWKVLDMESPPPNLVCGEYSSAEGVNSPDAVKLLTLKSDLLETITKTDISLAARSPTAYILINEVTVHQRRLGSPKASPAYLTLSSLFLSPNCSAPCLIFLYWKDWKHLTLLFGAFSFKFNCFCVNVSVRYAKPVCSVSLGFVPDKDNYIPYLNRTRQGNLWQANLWQFMLFLLNVFSPFSDQEVFSFFGKGPDSFTEAETGHSLSSWMLSHPKKALILFEWCLHSFIAPLIRTLAHWWSALYVWQLSNNMSLMIIFKVICNGHILTAAIISVTISFV